MDNKKAKIIYDNIAEEIWGEIEEISPNKELEQILNYYDFHGKITFRSSNLNNQYKPKKEH